MILVDHEITDAVNKGTLGIKNFDAEFVQPASYDLRIGPLIYAPPTPEKPIDLSTNGQSYRIPPYGSAVLMTYEDLKMPATMVGRIGLKSGFARKGLFASTGPQVDPGFEGKLFVSLLNLFPVSHVVSYKESFLTIEFHHLDRQPDRTYEGPYQGQYKIGHEIIEDLVRLEGLNLNQMQSQFSELVQHVKEWSHLAGRFDEFLREMTRHTQAVESLATRLSENVRTLDDSAPVESRKITVKQAAEEILELFKKEKRLFYSDIATRLQLDSETVIKACKQLERKQLIEGDTNGKKRVKKTRR